MASPISQIAFKVKRCEAELVVPANPTPREVKKLSNIDDQEGLRVLVPFIWFNKNNTSIYSKEGQDPVKVIREALGRVLVYYYPLAGRLKEGSNNGNLVVDCNGQGVLFVEADADVKLEQLGHPIQPPFPYLDEVLYNVPGSYGIIGCPLLLIQVTRMVCGGFILALRFNHTMFDGFGLCQFMNTLAEMAKGAQHPSIAPVWRRELLLARDPPRATRVHHEYCQEINDDKLNLDQTDIVLRSFIFGPNQIVAIKKHLPPHLSTNCSRFELVTACIWRCRTLALNMDQEEVVQLSCIFNGRFKNNNIDGFNLPLGYYGNAIAFPAAVSKAGALCENPLGYAVELVKKVKSEMNSEYIRSVADFMVIRGRPSWKLKGSYCVSELTKFGIEEIDFGWGCPEYGGPPLSYLYCYYYVKYKNNGEDGILVPVCLPSAAMDRFEQELKKIIEA